MIRRDLSFLLALAASGGKEPPTYNNNNNNNSSHSSSSNSSNGDDNDNDTSSSKNSENNSSSVSGTASPPSGLHHCIGLAATAVAVEQAASACNMSLGGVGHSTLRIGKVRTLVKAKVLQLRRRREREGGASVEQQEKRAKALAASTTTTSSSSSSSSSSKDEEEEAADGKHASSTKISSSSSSSDNNNNNIKKKNSGAFDLPPVLWGCTREEVDTAVSSSLSGNDKGLVNIICGGGTVMWLLKHAIMSGVPACAAGVLHWAGEGARNI